MRSAFSSTVVTALAVPALLVGALPAHADEAVPPRQMSIVGGERLGQPGTQVSLQPGAPKLPKKVTARSWVVADAETGEILAAHNAHWKLAPASTLKMLFAETLLPKYEKGFEYTVQPEDLAGMGAGSSAVGIKEDHSYTVHDLWNGVFLRSGNDAVHVLAAINGGMAKTAREMNDRARELGAEDTHVVSPDGYDADGQTSSAYDLTLIARAGMQNPDFRAYAATVRAKFPGGFDKKGKREHFAIETTNRLMRGDYAGDRLAPYKGLAGIKNGFTSNAGYTFTGIAQRGDRKLLVTVMHPDRDRDDSHRNDVYKQTAKLFDWGFAAAEKVRPVGELVPPVAERERLEGGEEGKAGGSPGTTLGGEQIAVGRHTGTNSVGTPLALTGASLALLAVLGYVVHRRWPQPAALSRRSPTAPTAPTDPTAPASRERDRPANPAPTRAPAARRRLRRPWRRRAGTR
ncbi:D-alanyl-D-alanine carboxypeptidase family protein [Streptomyces alkaliterrae]|uniref:D-alanyl-D-alanine carboxypeptidase family protein n=1 Tax=Streptomyces alkaliterrae TaxID=2213162 RepID=UPI001E5ADDD2|nr:serine hydrolase [Streptomyces alkaliterrae]